MMAGVPLSQAILPYIVLSTPN